MEYLDNKKWFELDKFKEAKESIRHGICKKLKEAIRSVHTFGFF